MSAPLRGIGWVTAAGWGAGRGGEPFSWAPGELAPLAGHPLLAEAGPRSGRMDELSRLGFVGIALALADAGLADERAKRPVALLASSAYGCLLTDADYYDSARPEAGKLASPNLFAYTLPNCFLGEAAIRFGLTGPNFVATEAGAAGLTAVTLALESLAWGECPAAVAGACDLPPPPWARAPAPPSGAVFLALGDDPAGGDEPYGRLSLPPGGGVAFEGAPVETLNDLVQRALARRPRALRERERSPCA